MTPRVRRSVTALLLLAGAPLALPGTGDLVDLVPADTYSVVHTFSDASTALPDRYRNEVIDAICDAGFDQWALESVAAFDGSTATREELESVRNVVGSLLGMVRWRDFIDNEFVYAESTLPLAPGFPVPSYLMLSRPPKGRTAALESSMGGLLAAIATIARDDVLYEVRDTVRPHVYSMSIPQAGNLAALQLAFTEDTVLVGMGPQYFDRALGLLAGGEGRRLTAQPVWERAFAGLPRGGTTRTFVDTRSMLGTLQGFFGTLAQREHDARLWSGLVNDAFQLVDFVDTIATSTHVDGTDVITESITRFRTDTAKGNPIYHCSQAQAASGELFEYVPAEAVSFSMRGKLDYTPLYRWGLDRLRDYWPDADEAIWSFEVAQAAIDLDIEDDLLSWLGSEHVTLELPSTRNAAQPGATESITLMRLERPKAARKVLDRFDAIWQAAAPRLLSELRAETRQIPLLPEIDVQIGPSEGMFPMLRSVRVKVGGLQVPELTYGVLGDMLIFTTSDEALETCMAVAAGELDGLWDHSMAAEVAEREGISSASLVPYGRQMAQGIQVLGAMSAGLTGSLGPMLGNNREGKAVMAAISGLMPRLLGVLRTIDYLDSGVSHSELREDGLASYERKLVRLLEPHQRPSYDPRARVGQDDDAPGDGR